MRVSGELSPRPRCPRRFCTVPKFWLAEHGLAAGRCAPDFESRVFQNHNLGLLGRPSPRAAGSLPLPGTTGF